MFWNVPPLSAHWNCWSTFPAAVPPVPCTVNRSRKIEPSSSEMLVSRFALKVWPDSVPSSLPKRKWVVCRLTAIYGRLGEREDAGRIHRHGERVARRRGDIGWGGVEQTITDHIPTDFVDDCEAGGDASTGCGPDRIGGHVHRDRRGASEGQRDGDAPIGVLVRAARIRSGGVTVVRC